MSNYNNPQLTAANPAAAESLGATSQTAELTPHAWVGYLRAQHADLLAQLADDTNSLARRNRTAGYEIVSSHENADLASEELARLLRECYGGTFPIPRFTESSFVQEQLATGRLTSFLLVGADQRAVGTSSLRHFNPGEWEEAYGRGEPIRVELARSASTPSPAAVTELMQARQLHLFHHIGLLASHASVFGDSRASVARMLPNGTPLASGAATQHSTMKNGLTPHYLHAKLSFGEEQVQEPFLQYELPFDKTGRVRYAQEHPLYLPVGAEGLDVFAADTFELAGLPFNVVSLADGGEPKLLRLENNGVYLEAGLQQDDAPTGLNAEELAVSVNRPDMPNALVVKIAAEQDNIATMKALMAAGFTATGVMPGTQTFLCDPSGKLVPYTQPHYVMLTINRRSTLANAPDMELPRELAGHRITTSAPYLWNVMRQRNVQQ